MQRSGHKRVPKVDVRKLEANYCEFVLSDTDASVANALRRVRRRTLHHGLMPDLAADPGGL